MFELNHWVQTNTKEIPSCSSGPEHSNAVTFAPLQVTKKSASVQGSWRRRETEWTVNLNCLARTRFWPIALSGRQVRLFFFCLSGRVQAAQSNKNIASPQDHETDFLIRHHLDSFRTEDLLGEGRIPPLSPRAISHRETGDQYLKSLCESEQKYSEKF